MRFEISELICPDCESSVAYAIGDSGVVVGLVTPRGGEPSAVRWPCDAPPEWIIGRSTPSSARAICGDAVVVGSLHGRTSRGFVWHAGSTVYLEPVGRLSRDVAMRASGTPETIALGVSKAGAVVGVCAGRAACWSPGDLEPSILEQGLSANAVNTEGVVAGTNGLPCVWRDGVCRQIDGLPATSGVALAISDRGRVVGWVEDRDGQPRPFISDGGYAGRMLNICGHAWAVNSAGLVVGNRYDDEARPGRECQAFLFCNGEVVNLNAVSTNGDWWLEVAYGINDAGVIVGKGTRRGDSRAFICRPLAG